MTTQWISPSDNTKACSKCRERKPAGEFASKPSLRTGLDSWCRECRRVASREWRPKSCGQLTRLRVYRSGRWGVCSPGGVHRQVLRWNI